MDIDFRIAMFAATTALLAGCSGQLQGDSVLKQVSEQLSKSDIGCSIETFFKGVGEGDADTAYAMIRLSLGEANARSPDQDVELMFSRQKNGLWVVTSESSEQLISVAKAMCE